MPKSLSIMVAGEKLGRKRMSMLLSRAELAEKAGLSEDHISKLERQEFTRAHMPTIRKLVSALDADVDELTITQEAPDSR